MSFRVLALDLTGDCGSIALADSGRVLEEVTLQSSDGFAHTIFGEIQALLARHGVRISDMDGFASASGPGAFTGVRVGLTAVKGLAEATGKRVVAVSNLRALASFGTRALRAPVMDARRGEIFGAVYDSDLRIVREEVVMPFAEWIAGLPKGDIEIVTNGFLVEASAIPTVTGPRALAGAIAGIATREFESTGGLDPGQIDANYVRRSDAEKFWKDPAGILMAVRIVPHGSEHSGAVQEFNQRLQAGGAPADYLFSESPVSVWLPRTPDAPVYNEFFLAVEDGVVRGAYALKHQSFSVRGKIQPVVFYHHPFSEGIVDKKYTQVGLQMLMHATRAHPVMYALGMGGYDRPLPKMLIAMKWSHRLVPFGFRVVHPARFLRNIQALRKNPKKRLAADIAAVTGTGWAAIHAKQAFSGWAGLRSNAEVREEKSFGDWAEEIWQNCAAGYSFIGVRDAQTLRALYPESNHRFTRLSVREGSRILGWAVVAVSQSTAHEQYGDLRVGTILDCLARPEDAIRVIAAATRALIERDVDLIVSNQNHDVWAVAMKQCGFFSGPSTFIFAVSPALSKLIGTYDGSFEKMAQSAHLNRGDGDALMPYSFEGIA